MSAKNGGVWQDLDRQAIERYKADDLPAAIEAMESLIELGKEGLIPPTEHERLLYNSSLFQPGSGLRIAILCFSGNFIWDGSSGEKGISGSEEAVIKMANLLASKGYIVTVHANPPYASFPWSASPCNPRYLTSHIFGETGEYRKYDLVLFWRRTDFALVKERRVGPSISQRAKIIYWPHDVYSYSFSTQDLNGVFWLSEYQKKQYEGHIPELKKIPSIICGNGYDPADFPAPSPKANPYSCGYFSNYSRGLEILLSIWPEVKAAFPRASLDLYYGREVWGTMTPIALASLVKKIESLKKLGVKERGKVGHKELAEAMSRLSLWTYPCNNGSETYCITAVKAQKAGMVPVVITIGALKETVSPSSYLLSEVDQTKYKELLFRALREVENLKEEEREKYRAFAADKTWEHCLEKWLTFFKTIGL